VKNGLGDPIIPFFLAVLILASAFIRSGLGRRLSSVVLSISRGRRDLILLGFLVSGAVLAMWLTAMASAAIMAPMAAAVLREGGGMEGARLRRRKQQDGSIYTDHLTIRMSLAHFRKRSCFPVHGDRLLAA
jgi:Na+/H+ antiporter NhaC